jgi:hypothetical protein
MKANWHDYQESQNVHDSRKFMVRKKNAPDVSIRGILPSHFERFLMGGLL